jgi:large subunit ribosomal protein L25
LHTEAGRNALINVDIEGDEKVLAVAREVQRHPVRGEVIHLDLIQISLDEAIAAEVVLEYLGTPIGVHEDGGFVEAIATTVNISALPTSIPGSIVVDIADMRTGDTLKVSDLPAIEGVEYTDDLERALVTVLLPRAEEEPEEALEIGEEGELIAAPEEGEAADMAGAATEEEE